MKASDLLKDQEAVKLALAFKKLAREYKTSIPEMVVEGKQITELIQHNQTDAISLVPMIRKLINEYEPDARRRGQMLNLIDSLNIKSTPKAFSALTLAFFFANNGVLTED